MSSNWLEKEEEYRKLNEELQKQNKILMEEFDDVLCEELKKVQKDNNKIEDEKEKWFQAYNSHKVTISKLENQITALNTRCQSKETENATLRKDMEQMKKEFKHTNLNITGNEVRLNRALEENDKMRNELKTVKQEEKQLKDLLKKEMGELAKRLQQVEKQKGELVTAYKKQIQLIDNLKKQKLYVEGLKIGEMGENEFMKILSWKIE